MKLAEALILRADTQKRIEQLRARLKSNAQIQEGDTPAEDPQNLISEFERAADELVQLIKKINATNIATRFDDGMSLADALAERDVLGLRHSVYTGVADAAVGKVDRFHFGSSDVPQRRTVNVAELRGRTDMIARQSTPIGCADSSAELADRVDRVVQVSAGAQTG